MDEIETHVLSWVKDNCLKGKNNSEVNNATSLLETNILNSMDFLKLVEHLSEHYQVEIDEEDMTPDNFDTAQCIAQLIRLRKSNDA